MMSKVLRVMVEIMFVVAAFLVAPMFLDKPDEAEALFRQATLINISEAALYALGALALFFAAVYLKALAEDQRMQTRQKGQSLEFITREFESRFCERSQYDPRPAPIVNRRPVGR